MILSEIRSLLDQKKGQKIQIEKGIEDLKTLIQETRTSLRYHEQAREIIKEVGLKTQQQLSYQIGEITSLALESVLDDPYTLEVEFVERRNKTECDLWFVQDGVKFEPLSENGGGTVDIGSFALRIASWSMSRPRLRNTIILDEPFKNLSKEYQEKGSAMLKEISKRMNIQFIIVTHEPILTSFADKIFEISKPRKNRPSKVKECSNLL